MKAYKSGKQRRQEIKTARRTRHEQSAMHWLYDSPPMPPKNAIAVDPTWLRPSNSYGDPLFVRRGYYEDLPFRCIDCGTECVWTAKRQRWWYEVARGERFTTARRCAPCRAKERESKEEARRRWREWLLLTSGQ